MHTADRIELTRTPSGTLIETTVHRYGTGDGPTVYVQAAQHGREINGTEVLRRVHEHLLDEPPVEGTLITVPVADPLTFDHVSYTTPESLDSVNANINRTWPGNPEGTLHERIAAGLWAYAKDADAIVDLHTGSPEMSTHTVYAHENDQCRALAEAFGIEFLLAEPAGDAASDEWAKRNFDGKLRVAAARHGIPAITPELAHNKQFVEPAIEAGVTGVENVLRHFGMRPGTPVTPSSYTVAKNHLGRVQAAESGVFHASENAVLGATVEPGTPLGTVYDPATYEVLQRAKPDRDGFVYSVAREATVTAGQTLVGIAEPRENS